MFFFHHVVGKKVSLNKGLQLTSVVPILGSGLKIFYLHPILRGIFYKRQDQIQTMMKFTGVYANSVDIAACES